MAGEDVVFAKPYRFTWEIHCTYCQRELEPAAQGNISADVAFRIYVCPNDARVYVQRSDGQLTTFQGDYLATRFEIRKVANTTKQEGGGDGE